MSEYDPQNHGARCDECYLRKTRAGGPVGPELKPGARALFVGEAPGGDEVEEGRPFVGESGRLLEKAMTSVGISRSEISLTNALCCRPPKNDLDTLLHKWERENKNRQKQGEPPLPHPVECCRPRLLKEMQRHPNIVTLGKIGTLAVTRRRLPILEVRGGPIQGHIDENGSFIDSPDGRYKVLPTVHPAFVARMKRWTRVIRADLSRAMRWFKGSLNWEAPKTNIRPTVQDIDRWLSRSHKFVAYDVETTMDDPLRNQLLCIGFATETEALVVPWFSIETKSYFYTDEEREKIKHILQLFFRDPKKTKVGHNAGYFDRMVIEHHFGVTPSPFLDTILLHRAVESELPHKLGFVGSIYTDVTAWKAAHTGTEAQTDRELHEYNATDCVVTARIFPALVRAATLREQAEVAQFDHHLQSWCVGMHRNGLYVDQERRKEHDVRLKAEAIKWLAELRRICGNPSINPSSSHQIRALLFQDWGLTPIVFTKLGDASTSDDVLRALRLDPTLDEQKVLFLDALRRFRKAIKLRGTYVVKLQPEHALRLVDDPLALDAEVDPDVDPDELKEMLRGIVWADGRFHSDYNAHGTTSGRLSSSGPNAQNFPRSLRDIVVAQPGHVLVGADMDQLELRFAAALSGAERYLRVFNSGGDPHSETAAMLYEEEFKAADKDNKKRMRDFSKRFSYACLYRASPETVHDVIVSVENNKGELIYAKMNKRETALLHQRWLGANPEFEQWWEADLREYRRQGFLLEPVMNRRRDFLDGEDPNEIANFKCQSGGSAIVHLATKDLIDGPLPFRKWGPGTGLVNQCHDSLTFEVPCPHPEFRPLDAEGKVVEKEREFGYCPPGCKCEANKAARVIQEAMTRRVDGLDVLFSASAKIGKRWSDT
jgi:uracil-DNA glycosylase family 4